MDNYRPEEPPGFPSFGHCYCPAQSSPVHGVSTKIIWCASIAHGPYSSLYLCALCSSAVHLADTRPHSPTTVAYESITHTSFIGSTYAIYREADHAPTFAYCPLHSSFINLAHIASRFLIAFFPNDALNPPSSSPPPHPRRHVLVAGIAVSTTGHYSSSSSKHHPRSIIICPRQTT